MNLSNLMSSILLFFAGTLAFADEVNFANSCLGTKAYESSKYYPDSDGSKAIDGDKESFESRWVSQAGKDEWLVIDLGKDRLINRIDLFFYRVYSQFIIEYFHGQKWTAVVAVKKNNRQDFSYVFSPVSASKIRIKGVKGGDGVVRLYEIEVYGDGNQEDARKVEACQAALEEKKLLVSKESLLKGLTQLTAKIQKTKIDAEKRNKLDAEMNGLKNKIENAGFSQLKSELTEFQESVLTLKAAVDRVVISELAEKVKTAWKEEKKQLKTVRWTQDEKGLFKDDSGMTYSPIKDSEGIYLTELDGNKSYQNALSKITDSLQSEEMRRSGFFEGDMHRMKLVEYIDCTKDERIPDNDGGRGGKSRILEINGEKYRVTDNRDALSYYLYDVVIKDPSKPHLLVYRSVNDIERYTTVRVMPPWSNIGFGTYTGREYPCDGKPYWSMFIFYPLSEKFKVCVSRMPQEKVILPQSGAAVSDIYIFEFVDKPGDFPSQENDSFGKSARNIGLTYALPSQSVTLFGLGRQYKFIEDGTRTDSVQRLLALARCYDYFDFCSLNSMQFFALDGGDYTRLAWYNSKLFPNEGVNLLEELLSFCDGGQIAITPSISGLIIGYSNTWKKYRFSNSSLLLGKDGETCSGFNDDLKFLNPSQPEVRSLLLDLLREVCKASTGHSCVNSVSVRSSWGLGLCYANGFTGLNNGFSALDFGYGSEDIMAFSRETGINVPPGSPSSSYSWLRQNAWQQWINWRCNKLSSLWKECRDIVKAYNPQWDCMVEAHLFPDKNQFDNVAESLKQFGYDSKSLSEEKGILITRPMETARDRLSYPTHPASNPEVNYLAGMAESFSTAEGTAVQYKMSYWEEGGVKFGGLFNKDNCVGHPFWGAATQLPLKRYSLGPLTFSLRKTNARQIFLYSWERGSAGIEHYLRRFARAFRSLPYTEPRNFEGTVLPEKDRNDERLWIRWFGDRLAVLNDSDMPRKIEIAIPMRLEKGSVIFEEGSRLVLKNGSGEFPVKVQMDLKPFDLKVISVKKM